MLGVKDLDYKVLNQLDDKSLVNFCKTNRQANTVCQNQDFWLQRIMSKFPEVGIDILNRYKNNRSWSEYYIQDLQINPYNVITKLMDASRNGRLDQVIISLNMDVVTPFLKMPTEISTEMKNRALAFASDTGHLDVVRYLIEHGADMITPAVTWASQNGHVDVVRYLVSKGADITNEAFRWASAKGHLDVVRYFVENGADVTANNNEAIYWANRNRHTDVVEYLLSVGAAFT